MADLRAASTCAWPPRISGTRRAGGGRRRAARFLQARRAWSVRDRLGPDALWTYGHARRTCS